MNLAAPHIGFVIAAYIIAFVVIAAMVIGTLADYGSLKKSLERAASRTRNHQDTRA